METVFAPAKLNLSLQVLGRRPDGYHELASLMVPISVGDRLQIQETESGLQIECSRPEIPTDGDSLLARTFDYVAERLGYQRGLRILLNKDLPVGAGLGGGSSDAVALIHAVAELTGRRLSPTCYPEVAHQLGADLPFFLVEGPAWVTGIGEQLEPVADLPSVFFLLVYPDLVIPTGEIYRALEAPLLTTSPPAVSVPPAFQRKADLLKLLTNDLESVALTRYPLLAALKQRLQELGADAALMSGSGSTVFGLFSQEKKRDAALRVLQAEHPAWWIVGAEPL